MMRLRTYLLLATLTPTISCSPTLGTLKKSDDFNLCINYVVDNINKCINGTNSFISDDKAVYDNEKGALVIFRGETVDNYYQKWEIPLKDLDPTNIGFEDDELAGNRVTVYTTDKKEKIKYFKEGQFESFTAENNYYLGSCMTKKKEGRKFIEAYRRAILLRA